MRRFDLVFLAVWIGGALASIGITIGVVYVLIHFIKKAW